VPDPVIAGVALNSVSREGAKNPAKPEEDGRFTRRHEDVALGSRAARHLRVFV
jgi:hypothetical protein